MPVDSFALLLRRLRKEAGRSQEQQADAINAVSGRITVTRREISRYEKSENIPTNHTLEHIAVACSVPFETLQREAKAARARRSQARRRTEQDLEAMKRRTVLEAAVVGVSTATAEPWGRLAAALRRGSRIDDSTASALIDRASDLHVQELNLSPRHLQDKVESHLDAITAALPRAGRHERALTIAAGETAALMRLGGVGSGREREGKRLLQGDVGVRGIHAATRHCVHWPLRTPATGPTHPWTS